MDGLVDGEGEVDGREPPVAASEATTTVAPVAEEDLTVIRSLFAVSVTDEPAGT